MHHTRDERLVESLRLDMEALAHKMREENPSGFTSIIDIDEQWLDYLQLTMAYLSTTYPRWFSESWISREMTYIRSIFRKHASRDGASFRLHVPNNSGQTKKELFLIYRRTKNDLGESRIFRAGFFWICDSPNKILPGDSYKHWPEHIVEAFRQTIALPFNSEPATISPA